MAPVAILWLFLMAILNVQGAMKKGLVCYIYGHYISALFNLSFMSIYCHIR